MTGKKEAPTAQVFWSGHGAADARQIALSSLHSNDTTAGKQATQRGGGVRVPPSPSTVRTNDLFPIEEQRFEVLVDKWCAYKDKASAKNDFAKIRTRLAQPEARMTLTTSEFFKLLREGHAVMPGVCVGGTRRGNWASQQVLMVDFDDGADPLEALDRCNLHGTWPDALYFTLSSTLERPRFRLVFILSEPTHDIEKLTTVMQRLLALFPESDQACKDPARMFLGSGGELWETCRLKTS